MLFNFFLRCACIFNRCACLRRLWAPGGEATAFQSSSFLMCDDRWMYKRWAPRMESSPVPLLLPSTRVTHSLIYSLKEGFLCIYCFPRVAAAAAKSLQSCLTLTPSTVAHQAPVPGILQARTLEWVAIWRGQKKKLCLWPQFALTPVSVLSFSYL